MSNAPLMHRRFAALAATLAWFSCASCAWAQGTWKAAPGHMLPPEEPDAPAEERSAPIPLARPHRAVQPMQQGTLGRLIENPDQTSGTPPYALTDQTGTVQRYVEPVPGINLAAYVGQIVTVRNDSGPTLLASQLDLPREPMRPLMMQPRNMPSMVALDYQPQPARRFVTDSRVEQAQYIDNDDSSVQLLPDGTAMPAGPGMAGTLPMLGDGYPAYPGYPQQQMMPGEMYGAPCGPQCYDGQCCEPMVGAPGMVQPYPGPMVGPYPTSAIVGAPQPAAAVVPNQGLQGPHISGDVEFLFFRPHLTDQVVGKLSETYEFSPRVTLDFRNIANMDGRLRYWHYARDTNVNGGGDIRLEWDVLDIEAMHYFEGRRSQVSLAAGIRLADIQLKDTADEGCGSDLIGLTMAADGLTPVCCIPGGYCGWVYGGRVSLLTGDWGGDDNSVFISQRVRDDNVLVTELYAGVELARRCGNLTVRGRALYEMQNWRSDALAQFAGLESISFMGPALQIGLDF